MFKFIENILGNETATVDNVILINIKSNKLCDYSGVSYICEKPKKSFSL